MIKINLTFYLLLLTVLYACSPDRIPMSDIPVDKVETFTIQTNRDTSIRTKEGILLHINSQTFESKEATIDLEFASFLDKSSMLLAGLNTMSADGRILESDGMFWTNTRESVVFNKVHPIRVEVPTTSIATEMKIFRGEDNDNIFSWSEAGVLNQNRDLLNITEGKKIFLDNCTSCHNRSLVDDMTGPALGNIHLFRDSAYLIDFTRNSYKVIASGNIIANCLYNDWHKSGMTTYEHLSDDQLNNIYRYIESESRNKNIPRDKVKYIDSCSTSGNVRYAYYANADIMDSVIMDSVVMYFRF